MPSESSINQSEACSEEELREVMEDAVRSLLRCDQPAAGVALDIWQALVVGMSPAQAQAYWDELAG